MSFSCRLKSINLPSEVYDYYTVEPLYNSIEINKQVYKRFLSLQEANSLIPTKGYNQFEVFDYKFNFIPKKSYLEIACGTGGLITEFAKSSPMDGFIGIDYAIPCIQRSIKKANLLSLKNIFFYPNSVEDFLKYDFKDNLFDIIMINFPDPWTKKKHIKRRVVQNTILKMLASLMKKSTLLIIATDVEILHQYHIRQVLDCNLLKIISNQLTSPIPVYKYLSNYAKKAKNKNIYYLVVKTI